MTECPPSQEMKASPKKESGPTWHWIALSLLSVTLVLLGFVYKLTTAQTASDISNLSNRVTAVESSDSVRDQKIENVSENIIRICNKLNIAQCQ